MTDEVRVERVESRPLAAVRGTATRQHVYYLLEPATDAGQGPAQRPPSTTPPG